MIDGHDDDLVWRNGNHIPYERSRQESGERLSELMLENLPPREFMTRWSQQCLDETDWRDGVEAEMNRLRADLARVTEERDTAQRMYNDRWGQLQAAQAETELLRGRIRLAKDALSYWNDEPFARTYPPAIEVLRHIEQALTSDPEPK